MTVASCPRCSENVTVPAAVDPETWVRCPLCQEEFALAEALARLPPPLVVLAPIAPNRATPPETHSELDRPHSDVGAVELSGLAEGAERGEALPFVVEQTASNASASSGGSAAAARSSRRQKSVAVELFKVAAGGLIGCVLAILILWWVFGADPFDAGLAVSRFAPWAVPAKYRQAASLESESGAEAAPSERDFVPEHIPLGHGELGRGAPGHGDGLQDDRQAISDGEISELAAAPSAQSPDSAQMPDEEAEATASSDDTSAAVMDPATPAGDSEQSESSSPAQASDEPKAESPNPAQAGDEPSEASEAAALVESRPTGVDLGSALERAQVARDAWLASEDKTSEHRRNMAVALYDSLARLGEAVTYVDPADKGTLGHVEQMRHMLLDLARHPKTFELIGGGADRWLKEQDRVHKGIVFIGKVQKIGDRGPLYETQFELSGSERRIVTVISRVKPADFYRPETRVLMLGAIVEQPSTHLPEYGGAEPMVVMGGYPLVLSGDRPS